MYLIKHKITGMKIGRRVKVKCCFHSLNYYEKGWKTGTFVPVYPSSSVTWVIIYLTASLPERDICEVIFSAHQKDCFIHRYLIKSFPMSWLVIGWYSARVVLGRGDFNYRLVAGYFTWSHFCWDFRGNSSKWISKNSTITILQLVINCIKNRSHQFRNTQIRN